MIDVVVIGAGPAGASAALVLARRGLQVRLVDPLGIGGQLVNVEQLPDYPGLPGGVAGWDVAAALGEAVLDAGATLVVGQATSLDAIVSAPAGRGAPSPDAGDAPSAAQTRPARRGGYRVVVEGAAHDAAAVLVATGCRPRPLPGAEALEGRGVSYCAACDAPMFSGRRVAVVGGGNVALAEAQTLASHAAHVTVVVPGPSAQADAAWIDTVAGLDHVVVVTGTDGHRVEAAADGSLAVCYRDGAGTATRLAVDGVFGALPMVANGAIAAAFAATDAEGALSAPAAPGLFIAGDVAAGSARRAIAAAGSGVTAALAIAAYLD